MPVSKFEKFLPISGVLAGILFAVHGYLPVTSDKYADPAALQLMDDNSTRNLVAAFAGGLFLVTMLFFATAVRQALRSAEDRESTYSSAAFAGGILLASSVGIEGWLLMAGVDAADHGDKTAVATLGYLGIDSWMPWVAASAVFFLATGLGALRTAVLPKWLSVVTVVLGVCCLLGPTGFAVWFATPVWLVVTGIVISLRQTSGHEVRVPGQPVHA